MEVKTYNQKTGTVHRITTLEANRMTDAELRETARRYDEFTRMLIDEYLAMPLGEVKLAKVTRLGQAHVAAMEALLAAGVLASLGQNHCGLVRKIEQQAE